MYYFVYLLAKMGRCPSTLFTFDSWVSHTAWHIHVEPHRTEPAPPEKAPFAGHGPSNRSEELPPATSPSSPPRSMRSLPGSCGTPAPPFLSFLRAVGFTLSPLLSQEPGRLPSQTPRRSRPVPRVPPPPPRSRRSGFLPAATEAPPPAHRRRARPAETSRDYSSQQALRYRRWHRAAGSAQHAGR